MWSRGGDVWIESIAKDTEVGVAGRSTIEGNMRGGASGFGGPQVEDVCDGVLRPSAQYRGGMATWMSMVCMVLLMVQIMGSALPFC